MRLGLLLPFVVTVLQAAELYSVSGVVVDSDTRVPMKGVRVSLNDTSGPQQNKAVTTGADGTFALAVPQGMYRLAAEDSSWGQYFGARVNGGVGVVTGPDQTTTDIVFPWYAPSSISGRVLDAAGEPAEAALVQLFRAVVTNGNKRVVAATSQYTNDLGEYHFGPLTRGSYYLSVTGTPWYTKSRSSYGESAQRESAAFAPVFFPASRDATQATPLILKPGQEARANFALAVVRGVTVKVICQCPPEPVRRVSLLTRGIGRAENVYRSEYVYGRETVLRGVPPGRYAIRIIGAGGNAAFSATRMVDVNAADVEVELKAAGYPSVSGVVSLKSSVPGVSLPLYAGLVNTETGELMGASIQPDGSFSFRQVSPGTYMAAAQGKYFLPESKADGVDLHDGPFEVAEGSSTKLELVASGDVAVVKGFAKRDGKLLGGVIVALV